MALTLNERSPTQLQIIKDAVNAAMVNLWTCLPCEVLEYDSDAVTVSVQPLIKIPVYLPDGEVETVELPMLLDVPVMFPCAGGFTITHPIQKGDECLVNFADRNIDLWWQSGGIQNPFDTRKHDLSDGFAFFRPQSQAKKISGISATDLEIRNDSNTCKIQIKPNGEIHFIGAKSVFHHPVEMQQTLSVTGASTLQSTLEVTGKSTMQGGANIGGIEFGSHRHGGVQSGGSDSGGPK
ncbi:Gp138 family membrane-puncturing spike protein [Acinetobacter sp. YH16053]|uniref:Gp138 family membrane-puncturing spike protein n=1 Tax=Acinetobacter sp. YH16053 TaxID=2601192 RepID=UPI0015D2BB59|nr:Gp138 family membrane-puncturing spike protein [Acinetobacter sp. YH16053]